MVLAESDVALLKTVEVHLLGYWLVVQDLLADVARELESEGIDRHLLAQDNWLTKGPRLVDERTREPWQEVQESGRGFCSSYDQEEASAME